MLSHEDQPAISLFGPMQLGRRLSDDEVVQQARPVSDLELIARGLSDKPRETGIGVYAWPDGVVAPVRPEGVDLPVEVDAAPLASRRERFERRLIHEYRVMREHFESLALEGPAWGSA